MPVIVNLKKAPEHLETIAQWHQAEWSHLNPGETLEQRKIRMRAYLSEAFIPSMFIALEKDRLLGTAAIVEHDMDSHQELSPWLASVYVDKRYRRQGIGSMLVQHVLQQAANQHIEKIFLFTPDQRAFYQQLGWSFFLQEQYHGEQVSLMQYAL